MTRFLPGTIIIEPQEPEECNLCHNIRELRPYGPPETPNLCFPCAMSTPELEAICTKNFYTLAIESMFGDLL